MAHERHEWDQKGNCHHCDREEIVELKSKLDSAQKECRVKHQKDLDEIVRLKAEREILWCSVSRANTERDAAVAVMKERREAGAELESLARQSGMGYYDLITEAFPMIGVCSGPRHAVKGLIKSHQDALLQVGDARPLIQRCLEAMDDELDNKPIRHAIGKLRAQLAAWLTGQRVQVCKCDGETVKDGPDSFCKKCGSLVTEKRLGDCRLCNGKPTGTGVCSECGSH